MATCEGAGKEPSQIDVQPEPGIRDIRFGRGTCRTCKRILALTKVGQVVGHKESKIN